MEEKDITQPVIDKCKQIALHWRMEIYEGCGVAVWNGSLKKITCVGIIAELDEKEKEIWIRSNGKNEHHYWNNLEGGWLISIPSISDCLTRLEELNFIWYFQRNDDETCELLIYPLANFITPKYRKNHFKEKTKHLVALSALFEVSKGEVK